MRKPFTIISVEDTHDKILWALCVSVVKYLAPQKKPENSGFFLDLDI